MRRPDLNERKGEDTLWRQQGRQRRRSIKRIARKAALRLAPIYRSWHDMQTRIQPVRRMYFSLSLSRYPKATPPLRVAFLSDLHYGPTVGHQAPMQAWRLVRSARPNMLILGGDYIYAHKKGLRDLEQEIKRCGPLAAGIWAVWGNHDDQAVGELIEIFQRCGVGVLCNAHERLPPPWNDIFLIGVDDDSRGNSLALEALSGVPSDACRIFVAHAPGIYEKFPANDCDLTLCGDTHGGQICLPNGVPLLGTRTFCENYIAGLYRPHGKFLYVSRGVGTVTIPLRLWAPPDVAIFDLHA